jgi:hypothetical protein
MTVVIHCMARGIGLGRAELAYPGADPCYLLLLHLEWTGKAYASEGPGRKEIHREFEKKESFRT